MTHKHTRQTRIDKLKIMAKTKSGVRVCLKCSKIDFTNTKDYRIALISRSAALIYQGILIRSKKEAAVKAFIAVKGR